MRKTPGRRSGHSATRQSACGPAFIRISIRSTEPGDRCRPSRERRRRTFLAVLVRFSSRREVISASVRPRSNAAPRSAMLLASPSSRHTRVPSARSSRKASLGGRSGARRPRSGGYRNGVQHLAAWQRRPIGPAAAPIWPCRGRWGTSFSSACAASDKAALAHEIDDPPVAGLGGAEGNRTPDLLNAIQALSQLSYGPGRRSL